MDAFWTYARGMLRYSGLVVFALTMAGLSALSLGTGIVGIVPVLSALLDQDNARTLREIAQDWNAGALNGQIPQWLIDALPGTGDQFTSVVIIICGLGVLTFIGGLTNFLHQYAAQTVVYRTVTNLRREAFHRVLRLPLKDVVVGGPSDSISRIVMDTAAIGAGFTSLLSKAVAQVTKGVAAFFGAVLIDFRLTAVALLVAPVLYTIIRKLGKRIRRASRGALDSQASLYGAASEALQGLRVVKVHTTERYEAGRFHRINKEAMRQLLRVRTARALASPLVEVLAILVLGGLSLVAVKAILDGKLSPADFIATLAALGIAGASLKPLTGIIADIQAAGGAADRIKELLNREPEPGHDARLPKLKRHTKSIELRDVTFTYPNADTPALNGVSLSVEHGETIAVVGPNGCGKTTLLAMVPRLFEPDEGSVVIDGVDIREVSVRSLRRQIGVVTQETVLFAGSVTSNIAYGAESVTEDKIRRAARAARADEFITKLMNGYATVLGEQGMTLSGGQRQRIAIARAILRDPSILILDEATSMIDADSEAKIAEAVGEFTRGRTCLIVAHRLSTVLKADRIVVMNAGQIEDIGGHEELLERCDVYKMIARNQLVPGSVNGLAQGEDDAPDVETRSAAREGSAT